MRDERDVAELRRLCRVESDAQHAAWPAAFAAALGRTRLPVCEPEMDTGPDGFPYLGLALTDDAADGERRVSVGDLLEHCTERARCGIVLFPDRRRAGEPEWVFSLGDLWSLRLFGSVDGDPIDLAERSAPAPADDSGEIMVAAPSDEFMPPAMRAALDAFLRDEIQLERPAVALVVAFGYRPARNVMLNLKGSMFRDAAHRDTVMHYISWFLPRSRGLMLMPEEWDDDRFAPLA